MNETSLNRFIRLMLSLAAATCLAACSSAAADPPLKGARIGGPFALTDQDGRTVRDSDFAGKYRIVYFGYTHCPDICPNDLAVIGQAMRRLDKSAPALAARIQPVFVTVDPERDTPAVMKAYTAAFYPRLVGLTGTPSQVVDHSRTTLLMGPKGEPLALLPSDQGADALVAELTKWAK